MGAISGLPVLNFCYFNTVFSTVDSKYFVNIDVSVDKDLNQLMFNSEEWLV